MKMTHIRATVSAWATALGVEPRTLTRKLTKAGKRPAARELISARRVFTVMMDEDAKARSRKVTAEAEMIEAKLSEMVGKLVPIEEAARLVKDALFPIRQRFDALPSELAAQCNPADPHCALEVLQAWRDRAMVSIRAALLPKAK